MTIAALPVTKTKQPPKPKPARKDQLYDEIEELTHVVSELRRMAGEIARGQTEFAGAHYILGRDQEALGRYRRLTKYLYDNEYPGPDILWVGLLVVVGLKSKRTFWVTNTQGAAWNIKDVKKLRLWLIDKGLATPVGLEGKDAYQFKPTQKLLTILQGEVRLSVLK